MTAKTINRTFVAPYVGGPLEGRLARHHCGIESVLIPTAGEYGPTWNQYLLLEHPDGTRVWQFQGQEVSFK